MKPALSLAVLFVAGCATPPPAARLTFYGSELRMETWTPLLVDRGHLHADLRELPCLMFGTLKLTDMLRTLPIRNGDELAKSAGGLMDLMCAQAHGPAYGGPERLVLALVRREPETGNVLEAIVLDLPRLREDETERRLAQDRFIAAWERPPKTIAARLERGWTAVRRLDADRFEFEFFLVLAPAAEGGPRTQVVGRTEAAVGPK